MSAMPQCTSVRRVRCEPCQGTGQELAARRHPDLVVPVLGIGPCFWCGGRGFIEIAPESDTPARCSACRKIGVVVDGIGVCPDCTAYMADDYQDGDDGFEGSEFGA